MKFYTKVYRLMVAGSVGGLFLTGVLLAAGLTADNQYFVYFAGMIASLSASLLTAAFITRSALRYIDDDRKGSQDAQDLLERVPRYSDNKAYNSGYSAAMRTTTTTTAI